MAQKQETSNHKNQHRSSAETGAIQAATATAQVQTLAPPPLQLKASGELPELETRETQPSNYLMTTGAAASPNDSPSDSPNEGSSNNEVS